MELKQYRNAEFLKICNEIAAKNGYRINATLIAAVAILHPAPSFFITEPEIAKIIRFKITDTVKPCRIKPVNAAKQERNEELYRRYLSIKQKYPRIKIATAARIIAQQSAPRFYISPKTALSLYYALQRPLWRTLITNH